MTALTSPPDTRRRTSYGIAIVLVAQLMLVLDVTVVNVALPRIQTDLDFSPAGLSWVLNAYTLAFGGLLLLGGRLGDVFGRLRVFVLGLSLFTAASLAGGLAPTPELLVTARVLQGVGAAIAAPSVLALLTTSTPDAASRNRALALFTAVSSAGGSIGLILGGALTDLGSWRWTLVINVPIGIAVIALVRRYVDETARRPGRFDVVGAATATLGSVAAVYAFINAPDHGWDSIGTIGGFALAAALLVIFVRTERRGTASTAASRPAAQPASSGRLGRDVVAGRLAVPDVLPAGAVRPARAGLRSPRLGIRVPAPDVGDLRRLADLGASGGSLRATAAHRGRHGRHGHQLPVAESAQHDQRLCQCGPRPDAAERSVGRPGLHAARPSRSSRTSSPSTPEPPQGCCRRCSSSAGPWVSP